MTMSRHSTEKKSSQNGTDVRVRHKGVTRAVAVGVGGLLAVVAFLFGLGRVDSGVASILATSLSLITSIPALWVSVRSRNQPSILDLDKQLDRATEQLADAVKAQWRAEAAISELRNAFPVLVRWSAIGGTVTDRLQNVLGTGVFNVEEGANQRFSFSHRVNEVTEMFNRLPKPRLVVLGEPGSGKTVLARHLTLGLLDQRQPGQPVAVLLPMVSWDPRQQQVHDWITSRLAESYPALGTAVASRSTLAGELVRRGRVLPILDGLDELPESLRAEAIRALDRSLAADDPLVLTCRSAEYAAAVEDYGAVLTTAAVVELDPLLPTEIMPYLYAATPLGQASKWDRLFAHLGNGPSGPLAGALSTPLMVQLAGAIYADSPADPTELLDINRFNDRHSIEAYLLGQFIPVLYTGYPIPSRFRHEDAQRWLSFFAQHLHRLNTYDLAWWQLTTAIKPAVALLLKSLLGLVVGLLLGLALGLIFGSIYGLAVGLIFGSIYGLAVGPSYRRSRSPTKVESRLRGQFWKSFAFPLLGGLGFGFAGGLEYGFAGGLGYGLVGGLAVRLMGGFTAPADIARAVSPRSVLQRDRAAAFINGLITGLASVLIVWLTFALIVGLTVRLASGLVSGLIVGLTSGLIVASRSAWFDFFLARGYFALRGQLPWPLMTFLNDAHHRGVLRQVGGVYQFRNAHLQDRLAEAPAVTPLVDGVSITEDERTALYAKLEERLVEDPSLTEQSQVEKVDKQDVGMRARELLKDHEADLVPHYRSLQKTLTLRNASALLSQTKKRKRRELVDRLIMAVGICLPIFVITDHLLGWSYQSWLVPSIAFIICLGVIALRTSIRRYEAAVVDAAVVDAAIAYDRARVDFQDQLYQLVIAPAIHKAARPNFIDPADELVGLTEARGLAARIESSGRVETGSFHRIGMYLRRSGGSTVGLAGTRGAGKTELLRWFCDADTASIGQGGTVGVLVAAPVAYEPQTFLRMLIRRLCAEVPGYQERAVSYPTASPNQARWVVLAVIVVIIFAGVAIVSGVRPPAGKTLGWGLIGVGCAALFGLLAPRGIARAAWNARPRMLGGHKYDVSQAGFKRRKDAARYAEKTAQRIRFAEKHTTSGEASFSWTQVKAKLTSETELSAIPLTEADLVNELTQLVKELKDSGYNVVIGIDELDKLDADDSAERFLNSIKVLFPIRGCSFLVSISENAWTRFVYRGVPIRDVFDSSLDTVILVERLTYAEARSFILRRAESMTDTQVLFCYCLSGGLPRDLLRFARQLGEANSDLGSGQRLSTVISFVLRAELETKIQGVLLGLRSREPSKRSLDFVAKLEDLRETATNEAWTRMLSDFLANDSEFANFATQGQKEREPSDSSRQVSADEWVVQAGRELFTYLNFLDAVRLAFESGGPISALANGDIDELLSAFGELAQARRRVEVDASAGWRKINEARRRLKLPPPGQCRLA